MKRKLNSGEAEALIFFFNQLHALLFLLLSVQKSDLQKIVVLWSQLKLFSDGVFVMIIIIVCDNKAITNNSRFDD